MNTPFLSPSHAKCRQFFTHAQHVFPDTFVSSLDQKTSLKVKFGIDPSSPDIHLGHWVLLKKLKLLQDMGHQIVFLIGNFTASIGDPTGKSITRPPLSDEAIASNIQTYTQQVFKLLDPNLTEIVYNNDWLSVLTSRELIQLTARSTVARLLERDDFSKRYQAQQSIGLHEFLYPLLQGHDSVVLRSDLEIGGTDQTFNLLMGRQLQKECGQVPQAVVTFPLLEGLDGVQKMSKSLNNHIPILLPAQDMFGKLMSIPDTLIIKYLSLLTDVSPEALSQYQQRMDQGENPKYIKQEMAVLVVTDVHDAQQAQEALLAFERVFSQRELPQQMPSLAVPKGPVCLDHWLVSLGVFDSKKELQRLASSQAISLDGNVVTELRTPIALHSGQVLRIGKRIFFKLLDESCESHDA